MNFVNRMGQMMAERGDLKRMNIVEKSALWYRLERIGQEPGPLQEETKPLKEPGKQMLTNPLTEEEGYGILNLWLDMIDTAGNAGMS